MRLELAPDDPSIDAEGTIDDAGLRVLAELLVNLADAEQEQET